MFNLEITYLKWLCISKSHITSSLKNIFSHTILGHQLKELGHRKGANPNELHCQCRQKHRYSILTSSNYNSEVSCQCNTFLGTGSSFSSNRHHDCINFTSQFLITTRTTKVSLNKKKRSCMLLLLEFETLSL